MLFYEKSMLPGFSSCIFRFSSVCVCVCVCHISVECAGRFLCTFHRGLQAWGIFLGFELEVNIHQVTISHLFVFIGAPHNCAQKVKKFLKKTTFKLRKFCRVTHVQVRASFSWTPTYIRIIVSQEFVKKKLLKFRRFTKFSKIHIQMFFMKNSIFDSILLHPILPIFTTYLKSDSPNISPFDHENKWTRLEKLDFHFEIFATL